MHVVNGTVVGSFVGQMTEFHLKHDDFNAWVERFELYILLNEINKHKKKLMFLILLGNEVIFVDKRFMYADETS